MLIQLPLNWLVYYVRYGTVGRHYTANITLKSRLLFKHNFPLVWAIVVLLEIVFLRRCMANNTDIDDILVCLISGNYIYILNIWKFSIIRATFVTFWAFCYRLFWVLTLWIRFFKLCFNFLLKLNFISDFFLCSRQLVWHLTIFKIYNILHDFILSLWLHNLYDLIQKDLIKNLRLSNLLKHFILSYFWLSMQLLFFSRV